MLRILAILLLMGSSTWAAEAPPKEAPRSLLRLFAFDLGGIGVLQAGGGDSESGWLSWSPALQFSPSWELKLMVGGTWFKSYLGSLFFAGDAELLAHYRFEGGWFLEAGGGAQYWTNLRGGWFPAGSAGGGIQTDLPIFDLIDRITLLYTMNWISTNPTHEARLTLRLVWPF